MIYAQSIIAALIPAAVYVTLIYYADRYEKEPLWLLAVTFFWGAVPAIIFALIFNVVFGLPFYFFLGEGVGDAVVASIVAPIVEESIKGAALLVILFAWRYEIDGILDGIIYGAMVGMGFAMIENIFYFVDVFETEGLEAWRMNVFMRAFVFGLNHSLYSAMTGLGIGVARMARERWLRLAAPVMGWSAAVFLHFVHNASASAGNALGAFVCIPLLLNAWGGVFVTLLIMLWALIQEKRWIKKYLAEEVSLGIITTSQYVNASSGFLRLFHRWQLLFSKKNVGAYFRAHRFYLRCSQLAYSKHHYATLRDDKSLQRTLQLRAEVAELSRSL